MSSYPDYNERSHLTREERIDLQQHDDGDPDDTVWFYRGNTRGVYHEDRHCESLISGDENSPREDSRRGAQRRWYSPCRSCVLGGGRNGE